jgi:hypothetical protein
MFNLRTVLRAILFSFFAGLIYKAIQQENTEWEMTQSVVNHPDYIALKKSKQIDNWLESIEDTNG